MTRFFHHIIIAVTFIMTAITVSANDILPISGSWINLFYQDVRNKYTNPEHMDNTDPQYWKAKVNEMHNLGIEYLVFMATANEGKADYPSKIMPPAYNPKRQSPVCAIMDEADRLGMKVFMSIGWAQNQDDNLRIPEILQRQKEIMDELAHIYGNRPSFYGWYLPVEDCLGPVLTDAAVNAVNSLVEKARQLTPGKKTMISPYGFFCSEFENPRFAQQIKRLKVDIIAYQDEVGCVREEFPLPRLKENWKKMKAIHNETGIEMWANCELFTWEHDINSRQSALIPAAMPRVISQLAGASEAGVNRIISFMVYGIWDTGKTPYTISQPSLGIAAANDYNAWRDNTSHWQMLSASFTGKLNGAQIKDNSTLFDGIYGDENPNNPAWVKFENGANHIDIDAGNITPHSIMMRFLNCNKRDITFPFKIYIYTSNDGSDYSLINVLDMPLWPNNLHDTWIDCANAKLDGKPYIRVAFEADKNIAIDEIIINPTISR